jgi:hypothetical protein
MTSSAPARPRAGSGGGGGGGVAAGCAAGWDCSMTAPFPAMAVTMRGLVS